MLRRRARGEHSGGVWRALAPLKMGGRKVSSQCPGGSMLTSWALALMKLPEGVLSRQLLRTEASPGASPPPEAGATISCVQTQIDSKIAPPKD